MISSSQLIEISNAFLRGMNLEAKNIEIIDAGLINRTWKVMDTAGGNHILQQVNTAVFPNPKIILTNMIVVAKVLEQSAYPGALLRPYPLQGRANKKDVDDSWRMIPFVEDAISYQKVSNPVLARNAAELLAAFHHALSKIETSRLQNPLPEFLNFNKRLDDYGSAKKEGQSERLSTANKTIASIDANLSIIEAFIELYNSQDVQVIHGDPKISNFLFNREGAVLALIDWDTIMPGSVLYDLGDMARSMCNKSTEDDNKATNVFDRQVYDELLIGYNQSSIGKALSSSNFALAAKAITLIQSVRFLTDFLQGDKYYHVSHAAQNLHRANNQLALFLAMKTSL